MATMEMETPLTLAEAVQLQVVERHSIFCGMVVNYCEGRVDGEHVARVLREVLFKPAAEFEAACETYRKRTAWAQTLADATDLQTQIDNTQAELDSLYELQREQTLKMRGTITNKLAERDSLSNQKTQAESARRSLESISDLGRALVESRHAAQRDEIERQLLVETDARRRGDLQERLDAVDVSIAAALLKPEVL